MVYCGRRGIIILIEQFPMTTYSDLNSTGEIAWGTVPIGEK